MRNIFWCTHPNSPDSCNTFLSQTGSFSRHLQQKKWIPNLYERYYKTVPFHLDHGGTTCWMTWVRYKDRLYDRLNVLRISASNHPGTVSFTCTDLLESAQVAWQCREYNITNHLRQSQHLSEWALVRDANTTWPTNLGRDLHYRIP